MVRDEVLPLVRERYGVGTDRARYAVAGSSLGGLVSVYFADAGAATFGYAMAMSSTLGWGAFNGTNSSNAFARSWTHTPSGIYTKIYIDSGGAGPCSDTDNDGVMEDSDDTDNFCVTQQFVSKLMSLGYQSGTHYVYTVTPGADHNEASWAARFPSALNALASMGWQ